jgi:hypothetical protein
VIGFRLYSLILWIVCFVFKDLLILNRMFVDSLFGSTILGGETPLYFFKNVSAVPCGSCRFFSNPISCIDDIMYVRSP